MDFWRALFASGVGWGGVRGTPIYGRAGMLYQTSKTNPPKVWRASSSLSHRSSAPPPPTPGNCAMIFFENGVRTSMRNALKVLIICFLFFVFFSCQPLVRLTAKMFHSLFIYLYIISLRSGALRGFGEGVNTPLYRLFIHERCVNHRSFEKNLS